MLNNFGGKITQLFAEIGEVSILLKNILLNFRHILKDRRLFFEQAVRLGFNSLPLVILVGFFTGAVSAWQANYQFQNYLPSKYLGFAVYKAVVIELAPVLTGLVIAGRVSASIAAELGSMKVTEQIDALESLAIDPVRFLAMPRVSAMTFLMPVLTVLSGFVAVVGGVLVAMIFMNIGWYTFFVEVPPNFKIYDFFVAFTKALTFGGITSLMGCYIGMSTVGGAEGVGKATIQAFVWSSILILMSDYILATILF